ncbi:MAG: hypothetical protein M3463_22445 [Verrucomicrobiota bacterium]|nr:hypothetical protein [Verrucomicrobiota bacterium]
MNPCNCLRGRAPVYVYGAPLTIIEFRDGVNVALFEPRLAESPRDRPPASHRHGPIFLKVLRERPLLRDPGNREEISVLR